ncbi:MAG: hypothetical protein OEW29_08450 [Acidimicrobiia bacterium]|nr:hypothetical protein [Acidimicrobiia bacterium]MDH4364800.1 hypothetical protein [Acidimicrobiia bacterium]
MANKSKNQPANAKKPSRTLKEKRAAKHAKQEAKIVAHKAWEK